MCLFRWAIVTCAVAAACGATPVLAQQPAGAWRVRASADAGVQQPASTSFSQLTKKTVYREDAVVNTSYTLPKGQQFGGGITVRLIGNLGVGVAVSSFTKSNNVAVAGTIPHPFFYNTPRSIAGAQTGLERNEVATHLQAVYVILPRGRINLALSGGPSWFSVKQDVVTDVSYSESYPYDAASFSSATFATVKKTGVGFNVGADIGVRLVGGLGVGALVRYSKASLTFSVPNSTASVASDVGGLQLLGGIRFIFSQARKQAPRRPASSPGGHPPPARNSGTSRMAEPAMPPP
jgi:hypothetical protein